MSTADEKTRNVLMHSLFREPHNKLVKDKEMLANKEICLSYAIYLAENGQVGEVFDVIFYIYAYYNHVSSEQIYKIICKVVENLRNVDRKHIINWLQCNSDANLSCPMCYSIIIEPITEPCGHTFCRRCLEKERPKSCKVCQCRVKSYSASSCKTNVLISNLTNKWWSQDLKAARLRKEGNLRYIEKQFEEALRLYSEAIELGKYKLILYFFSY